MSDTWRSFTLRRTIGGDVVRSTTGWQGALRYGPKDYPFDIVAGSTLTGYPFGYDSTYLTVQVPASVPNRGQYVLVRGAFGYPTTPMDGVVVWRTPDNLGSPVTAQFNQIVVDQPLTDGYWYYYTLFVKVVDQVYPAPAKWIDAARVAILVPRNYGHAEKLFEMLPEFYQRTDYQQAADGRFGPFKKFMATIGYDADYNRTLLDGVINVYDPDLAPLEFVQLLGTNLGLPTEQGLGGARYRTLVGKLWDLEGMRGTQPGLQQLIYAASNYRCDVTMGQNTLLTPDDTEFVNGTGHWQPFTNPIISTFKNYFTNATPPPDPYTNLVVRPYPGSASPPLPKVAGGGQGILQAIDMSTTATYKDITIVCGLTQTGLTNGAPDALQIGIPVVGNQLWEFSFWMCHNTGDPNAQVVASWATFDLNGVSKGVYPDDTSYAPDGYLLDGTAWVKYRMQHVIATKSDGLTADPSGGVCGYVIPCIWWHATTPLKARYIMGAQLTHIQGVGGAIQPLPPDIYLTLGVATKLIGPDPNRSRLGP